MVQVREERLRQSGAGAAAERDWGWRARLVDSGAWIDTPGLLRLGCGASVACVRTDDGGNALDVGRRQPTVPPALRRALGLRDHGRCCFPGCDNQLVDAYHVRHWARGGDTKLTNVLSSCASPFRSARFLLPH
ncbi:MAG: hypothetical protein HY775_12730 [Acidobacteria bacterium]|nr:hypothetical protein [Acidobacteriota bacterium]